MAIRVINGSPRFVKAIDDIFLNTWLSVYPNEEVNISEQDILDHFKNQKARLRKRRLRLESLPKNERFFIAKEGNNIVGICSIIRKPDRNELYAIYILPKYQGKGIGRLLWEESLNFFDKKLPIIVDVATYNIGAISFYKNLGFSEHKGKFHTNDWHELKNGKKIPTVTMTVEHMNKPQIIQDVGFDFSWDIEKVWKLNEPTVVVPIDTLLWHFDIPFWETEGTDDYNLTVWETLANPDREISHWGKILAADLSYPLDVMPNKGKLLLLDGLHRLAKTYLQGKKEANIRIIPRSRIPEITSD